MKRHLMHVTALVGTTFAVCRIRGYDADILASDEIWRQLASESDTPVTREKIEEVAGRMRAARESLAADRPHRIWPHPDSPVAKALREIGAKRRAVKRIIEANREAIEQIAAAIGQAPEDVANQFWYMLGQRIAVNHGGTYDVGLSDGRKFAIKLPCASCGGPVEPERLAYVVPTCFKCLPPPEPLPVAPVRELKGE